MMAYGLSLVQPPRKKTKAEVMEEVIAKSKEHKVSESVSQLAHID